MADNSQRGQKSVSPLPLKMLGRRVRAPDVDGAAQAEAHRHQGPRGQERHHGQCLACSLFSYFQCLCFLSKNQVGR